MSKAAVLIVDDEEDIREVMQYNLRREGYAVTAAATGEQALELLRRSKPDVVLLDLMLPGVDGLDICRRIKSAPETAHITVIMLTARAEEADMVTGLELGADDYITKPFSPRVVAARIKAALRRREAPALNAEVLDFGRLTIHMPEHVVRVDGAPLDLTATEFRVLTVLTRRPGWALSREQIVAATQSANADVTGRSVDVHIVALRKKMGACGACIETVRGVGYRFRDPRDG